MYLMLILLQEVFNVNFDYKKYKDGQLKTFFVGGPNSRKDFHMEEGEEFFYMLKGDMRLVVAEKGQFRDIKIREGEVFLLPAQRSSSETDLLRYYIDGSDEILYEKWFHCENLEELGPLIKEYFNSEAHKTGRPIPGSLLKDKLIKQDFNRRLDDPFPLRNWLKNNEEILDREGKKRLFEGNYVSREKMMMLRKRLPIAVSTFCFDLLRRCGTLLVRGCSELPFPLPPNNTT
ncbi:3-hydroxyanthranilate 3,4-dioxygenase [Caerostris darwini]|uniref:3-hydroxyanthranilate 3,4-dioxygenase n=1 Tax=Caerostris darwini TaxID=1538125 RepID=A0AAV4QUW7_9ARAC|nr:3-hydroxyanthranilate 3,4-dioxygenase [Caerostris darwini]